MAVKIIMDFAVPGCLPELSLLKEVAILRRPRTVVRALAPMPLRSTTGSIAPVAPRCRGVRMPSTTRSRQMAAVHRQVVAQQPGQLGGRAEGCAAYRSVARALGKSSVAITTFTPPGAV
jgi:hypothetical protein